MAYNFTAEWIKGKKDDAPDAFSRNPLLDPEKADTLAEIDTNGHPEMTLNEIRTLHGGNTVSLRLENMLKKRIPAVTQFHPTWIPCPTESTTRPM